MRLKTEVVLVCPQAEASEASSLDALVTAVNAQLPGDIRVFSATRVSKGFRPRDATSFRVWRSLVIESACMPHQVIG
jgi:tRNA U38,U39,U40 pseudouridine synthase TruA